MFWNKQKETVIDLDLTKKKEPKTVIDRSKFEEAAQYKIGLPILNTGVKFYPVFEKTEKWPCYWYERQGTIFVYATYEKTVEYFTAKEDAEKFIAAQPQAKEQ
jgi:hypothetical protein